MRIPSNAIILDLLALHTALDNKALDAITEKFESILNMLDDEDKPFDEVEAITDETKKAVADAGYSIKDEMNPVVFLRVAIATLLGKKDPGFSFVIFTRLTKVTSHLLSSFTPPSEEPQPCSTSNAEESQSDTDTTPLDSVKKNELNTIEEPTPHQTEPVISEENQSEVDIISKLIENLSTPENDSQQMATLLHALFRRTIDAVTQQNIIKTIAQASNTHAECLLSLKKTINYYLTSDPERLAEAKAIRTNKTSLSNGLLFIEHIGQTHFEIHKSGHFLDALDKVAKGKTLDEKKYAEFGLFRPAPPATTPAPSNSFTNGSKIW